MANYATLKAAIQQVIKQNGNNEITGALLQQSLLSMINSLGAGYQFISIATPSTVPGTPDYNVFYIALQPGVYSSFGPTTIENGQIGVFSYNGTWTYNVQRITSPSSMPVGGGELDMSFGTDFPKIIGSNGNYAASSASNYAKIVDISAFRGCLLTVTANTVNNGIIAFLINDDTTTIYPRYCYGETGRRVVSIGTSQQFTIPDDVKYLYVVVYNNNADATPKLVLSSAVEKNILDTQKLAYEFGIPVNWLQGSIVDGKINTSNLTRCCADLFLFAGEYRYEIPENYSLYINGWVTGSGVVSIANDGFVGVLAAKGPSRNLDIIVSEANEIKLYVNNSALDQIRQVITANKQYAELLFDKTQMPISSLQFFQGGISGSGVDNASANRIKTIAF